MESCGPEHDKVGSLPDTFWKAPPRALPGRPQQWIPPAEVMSGSSFQDFQASVNDAWDLGDDEIVSGIAEAKISRSISQTAALNVINSHRNSTKVKSDVKVDNESVKVLEESVNVRRSGRQWPGRPRAVKASALAVRDDTSEHKLERFTQLHQRAVLDLNDLKKISWSGIPPKRLLKMAKVKIEQGWLEGEELETCVGDFKYYSFKGIPYALPPLGKLRFKAPQPPVSWDGVRPAKEHGPNCPQLDIFTKTIIPGNEDCLYLNVYSPNLKPLKPLAVLLFIHGGGYQSGSGDITHYAPDFLIQHDVVVVTINYRVGALGFLCMDTKDVPGNAGLKDQVAAMKWVQKNINSFGGDPNNVTIMGESAGGASTALHILSPMSKGLFKRAIPMSGVPSCDWSIAYEPTKRAFTLGKQLGLNTKNPEELFDFLQSLPADKFIETKPYLMANELQVDNLAKFYPYSPVIEKSFGQEQFIGETLGEILKKGFYNDVDILIGYTSCETAVLIPNIESKLITDYNIYNDLFTPRKILNEKDPTFCLKLGEKIMNHYFPDKQINLETIPQFMKYQDDITIIFHVVNFLNHLKKAGNKNGKIYQYKFGCYSKRNIYGQLGEKYGMRGAAHLDDLVYLFDPKFANLQIKKSSKEYQLVTLTCSLFTNFAKYGTPTPDSSFGVEWPPYDTTSQAYGDIGDKLTVGYRADDEAVQFWNGIYEEAGVDPLKLYY